MILANPSLRFLAWQVCSARVLPAGGAWNRRPRRPASWRVACVGSGRVCPAERRERPQRPAPRGPAPRARLTSSRGPGQGNRHQAARARGRSEAWNRFDGMLPGARTTLGAGEVTVRVSRLGTRRWRAQPMPCAVASLCEPLGRPGTQGHGAADAEETVLPAEAALLRENRRRTGTETEGDPRGLTSGRDKRGCEMGDDAGLAGHSQRRSYRERRQAPRRSIVLRADMESILIMKSQFLKRWVG